MLIRPRRIVAVGLQTSTYVTLMSELGMRAGVDEVRYFFYHNPGDAKIEPSPDVMVLEAGRGENPNQLRIRVRDIGIAYPNMKLVVVAYGMASGRLNAHAVVHDPTLQALVKAVKPLLPSATIDA